MIELEAFPPGPMLERRADLWRDLRLRLAEGPPITFPSNDHLRRDMTAFTTVPSFTCPLCGARSFNPHDLEHRYCGRCHVFVDDVPPRPGPANVAPAEARARGFFTDDALNAIANYQLQDGYRDARAEHLTVLLATRADKTGDIPPDWRPEVLWCWHYLALKAARDALFVGQARGGFSPSDVRWVVVCWAEPEPRRSRMLGLPAPWRPRVEPLATPWEVN